MSRKWSFTNLRKFKSANVTKPYNNHKNIYRLSFSVMNGGFPDSNVIFNNIKITLDQTQIARLLRATLNEYQPKCCLGYKTKGGKSRAISGKIISFYYLPNNQSKYKVNDKNPFVVYLKLYPQYRLPLNLKNIKINIRSRLLPRKKYQYGFCDTYGSKFKVCTDKEYMSSPGISLVPDNGVSKGRTQCMVFRLRPPQSPKTYCKFDIGF